MKKTIDCSGLKCPLPIVNSKKYFDSIEEGGAIIIVDNEIAKNNVKKFADSSGYKSQVEERREEEKYYITIEKEKCCECSIESNGDEKFTIVIGSNKLGVGEDKLGDILMKSYLYALSETDNKPTDLIFLNSGVKLTVEGSDSLESLNKIKDDGINILVCGTCLDFYDLKEKIKIGEISNMYTIVETMNIADKIVKL